MAASGRAVSYVLVVFLLVRLQLLLPKASDKGMNDRTLGTFTVGVFCLIVQPCLMLGLVQWLSRETNGYLRPSSGGRQAICFWLG